FIYTFVSPKLMANSVDVHPALVILALLAGSAIGGAMSGFMGGLVGMLASIPAVAVAKSVFVYYFEKRTGRRIVSEDGVFFKGTPSGTEGMLIDPLADSSASAKEIEVPWASKRVLVKDKTAGASEEKEEAPADKKTDKDGHESS
ncbi:MAG: AI-2E family transporter, partial [Raoultibacter sp.]